MCSRGEAGVSGSANQAHQADCEEGRGGQSAQHPGDACPALALMAVSTTAVAA